MELEHFDVVSRSIGQTLTPQERSTMEIGLIKRRVNENLKYIRFWGRIHGEKQDYLIAVAILPSLKSGGFPQKKFYFATNSSPELQQFPELEDPNKRIKASQFTSRLKGDPSLILSSEDTDDGTSSPFTELDRLAYIVEEIDTTTSCVPLEAFVVAPTRQVVQNGGFHGLNWDQATCLSNWFHFRPSTCSERTHVLTSSEGLVRAGDFMDSLTQDLEGSWIISKDNTGSFVTLRNYLYPGAFVYHAPETTTYGSVYFGDGLKNTDFAFMI
jgi:radial spoke head protein 9